MPELEEGVHQQALALAEARAQLSSNDHTAKTVQAGLKEELRIKSRQLEESSKQWRCHKHDGETRMKLLEEQVQLLSAKSDTHASLAAVSNQLSSALLSESGMRKRLEEAERALLAADAREATLRAAASAAIDSEANGAAEQLNAAAAAGHVAAAPW